MERSPVEAAWSKFLYTKISDLEKSNFRFLTVFLKLLTLIENFPPKSEVLVLIARTCCAELCKTVKSNFYTNL